MAFFPDDRLLQAFQAYLDSHLPDIANAPERFGYQVVADEEDQILYEEKKLLLSALDQPIDKIEQQVRTLHGIFIPAHIDKPRFSLLSQLGFIPPDLPFDALELSPHTSPRAFLQSNKHLSGNPFIQSSDAHYPDDFCKAATYFNMPGRSFREIRMALDGVDGRSADLE